MSNILSYPGSKWNLAPKIVASMPPHETFVEVFGGTAAVLITKPRVRNEIYNDIDDNLVTLFQVVRDPGKRQELIELLLLTPYSRSQFNECHEKLRIKDYENDVEQAWLTFVVSNQSISGIGLARSPSWSMGARLSIKGRWTNKIPNILRLAQRFERVQIECRPWEFILSTYDTNKTLFYLDPPYVTDTREPTLYNVEMFPHEHTTLIKQLLELKGMAIVSGYDHSYYERLTDAGWERVALDVHMTMSIKEQHTKRTEILWYSPNCKTDNIQQKLF